MKHNRVLLDLAAWLEMDNSPVMYLMADDVTAVLRNMTGKTYQLPEISGMKDRLHKLLEIAVVVQTVSLVRNDFCRGPTDLHKRFMRGLLAKQDSGQFQAERTQHMEYIF